MSNYRSGYLEQGAPIGATRKDVLLSADNQIIDLDGVSAVYLQSDNTTATNRTFTLKSSDIFGQEVVLLFESGSSYTCDLQSAGNAKLAEAWQPIQYDSLTLRWDGTYWIETARGGSGGGLIPAGSIVNSDISASAAIAISKLAAITSGNIIVGSAATVPTSVTMSGDATIIASGALTIANSAITNAKVSASAAIDYSKLAALTSANILVGSAGNVATVTAVTGDVTISNAGVTAIASDVIVNADVKTDAAIAYSKLAALTDAHILVGSATNVATDVAVTGDVTISNAGVTAIASGVVVNADVSASAAIDFSKLATLTSGNIIVGSAGNVPTSVAMAGDVTIVAAGTTTIGAAKVTEAMLIPASTAGLQARRVAYAKFDPSANAGQRPVQAHDLGVTIPDNAFVVGAWYWVETTFTSATDAGTVALSLEGANDIVSAIAINDGTNPWDSSAKPVEGITKLETTSTWLATTAARAVTATVAVEALTAGKLHIWLEYQLFS